MPADSLRPSSSEEGQAEEDVEVDEKGKRYYHGLEPGSCVRWWNEIGVIRVIGELIIPSAEEAIDPGHVSFQYLIKSVNEAWNSSISFDEAQQLQQNLPLLQALQPSHYRQLQLPRPQPDYAVGFNTAGLF
ncbi:hypothetical protein EMCG_03376 [[Emmonsia] crescens]|uniref:DUF7924 domain-containing protein n=1 Tax=[Emmonsia] crescens TaxID=73230 RepID=A0A0G2HV97_9EURO|nr:hypothetical protein EMCG_03376 [Emmonsia crescens UAMH 3008]